MRAAAASASTLCDGLALAAAAGAGPLVYIETEYFGGEGGQAAAAFAGGGMAMRASIGPGKPVDWPNAPINTALRLLGVVATADYDEFDVLGLGGFRGMRDLGIKD